MTKQVMAGIDLHSNNLMIGIVDQSGKRLKHQKVDCDLKQVTAVLEAYKARLKSVAVESTYNWYWLEKVSVNGIAIFLFLSLSGFGSLTIPPI